MFSAELQDPFALRFGAAFRRTGNSCGFQENQNGRLARIQEGLSAPKMPLMAVETCLIRSGQGAGIGWSLPAAAIERISLNRQCDSRHGCRSRGWTRSARTWRDAGRFDALSRRSVRAAAVSPPFPLGGVLPSTASAEGKPSSFGRFSGVGSEEARSIALALASVRRTNWTCSFPASSFHERALAA
jgi:hypothetical protein